ncbi:GH25 family lysozyme [Fluviicola sp.]|jgi:lysozyme|uniref:glycoside hydrolase family 25 protein n=1 Tax=Fluviicola sp. TaxID=1917219 RepID=UPI00282495C9|nr:GH25 family lysozyme [Fluviicola sp.]MDR0803025.1 glycoside hydrolase family 25 protein [Fluviicola sp.]
MAKRKVSKKRVKRGAKKRKKNKFFSWVLIPIGIAAFIFFWYKSNQVVQTSAHFHEIIPPGYKSVGLDVSHHQGVIDWDLLLTEKGFDTIIDFVYCKVTEGSDHIDTQWQRNRDYLNKHGISNGAYHYFNPKSLPRPQAAFFLANYQIRSIDLPPVLDVEDEGFSDEDLRTKIQIWCEEVKKATGIKPIIYTSLHFYETKFRGKMDGYNFWIAAYDREPEYMTDREVLHWQFSKSGRLPGISEDVDLNVSKLDLY